MMPSIVLGTRSSVKILCLFSHTPGRTFTRMEIQQMTKLANNPLSESLKVLVGTRVLKKNGRKYALNFENDEVNDLVEFFKSESRKLRNQPYSIWLILFESSTRLLAAKLGVKMLYLFGSQAKLIAHEKSDIDLAIVLEKKREPKLDLALEKIASALESRFGRKIQIHTFEAGEFTKNKTAMVNEILRDGIRIF